VLIQWGEDVKMMWKLDTIEEACYLYAALTPISKNERTNVNKNMKVSDERCPCYIDFHELAHLIIKSVLNLNFDSLNADLNTNFSFVQTNK